jgi:hypothetical protein
MRTQTRRLCHDLCFSLPLPDRTTTRQEEGGLGRQYLTDAQLEQQATAKGI